MRVLTKSQRAPRGFTSGELLVVLITLLLLGALLVPGLILAAKRKAARIKCANNLKNIGLAIRIFSTDQSAGWPQWSSSAEPSAPLSSSELARSFQSLSNELSATKILICPADSRKPALDFARLHHENVSYFFGLNAKETASPPLLAGDRNLTIDGAEVGSGQVEVSTNSTVGWSAAQHHKRGHVMLGDGSVQQFDERRFTEFLMQTGQTKYRLLIP